MFRFTIRDVLWLTVVVGLALGWGLDHRLLSNANAVWQARYSSVRDNRNRILDDLEKAHSALQRWPTGGQDSK